MTLIKCRFCYFTEDDPERTFNIDRKLLKDLDFDLYYDPDTGQFSPAVYESYYAVITCPNHKCERVMVADKTKLAMYLVKTEESPKFSFIPIGESLFIGELTENYSIICYECPHLDKEPNYDRKIYIDYDDRVLYKMQSEPSPYVEPCLFIECKNLNCVTGFEIKPKLEKISEVVPSTLLSKLKIQAKYSGKPERPEGTKTLTEKIKDTFLSEENIKRNVARIILSQLAGQRVLILESKNEKQSK